MAKRVEGALYKMTGEDSRLPEGTIVRLIDDDGTKIPFFKAEARDICLNVDVDVKLLKPKEKDKVQLYRLKHTKKDAKNVGYYPERGMMKKGDTGTLVAIDKSDGTAHVIYDGDLSWYYLKDLAVIERKGVSI